MESLTQHFVSPVCAPRVWCSVQHFLHRVIAYVIAVGVLSVSLLADNAQAYEWPGKLAQIARGLSSSSATERAKTIQELVYFPPAEVVPGLAGMLDDPAELVKIEAIKARKLEEMRMMGITVGHREKLDLSKPVSLGNKAQSLICHA